MSADDHETCKIPDTDKRASPSGAFMNVSLDILTPTVLANTKAQGKTVAPEKSLANSAAFNLADFENEEDPFDILERKTLDDMVELNKVLQGAQNAEGVAQEVNTTTTDSEEPLAETDQSAAQSAHQVNVVPPGQPDAIVHQAAPLDIKDVEYPDFDTLETPDVSLSDPSYSIPQQNRDNATGSYSGQLDSQGQVNIHTGNYSSVSFSNKKPAQASAVQNNDRTENAHGYSPLPPIANPAYSTNEQRGTVSNTSSQHLSPKTHVYGSAKHTSTDSQQQHSVINGLTQYSSHGNNPWSSAVSNNNPWAMQAGNKNTANSWQPPKSYTTSNPWNPNATTYNQNPWTAQTTTQSTNPWGPPSLYASSSSSGNTGTLRSAKSNPDLSKLLDRPVRVLPTSHTPPPTGRLSGTTTPPPRPSTNQVGC